VIASPVGANQELVAEGRGIGARSPAEWEGAIEEIGREAEIRRQMGSAGRGFVEREYSYQVWAPRVAELLRDLTS
jgi:glycosyltransferase involved in cell wall biosynthesis